MIRFAVFTDLHYDHIPDGDRRIKEFLETVRLKILILSCRWVICVIRPLKTEKLLTPWNNPAYRCIIQSAIMIRIGIRLKK